MNHIGGCNNNNFLIGWIKIKIIKIRIFGFILDFVIIIN